ncbi:DUF1311 domain-containing protein [Halopseudomonas nanhaiensis]|uniref:lysozyme inhibitor LprI family protein n=1 Tax=Halopseudomonas nanhaiensis TaxID=2830842 RepID=UPI001CC16AE4|nr:lysozyme inhibitor LprI family protein [Halopseudomonas nanhaiensis]UAW97966.1 DUF1311 domain-containing protein [Halopseudomonas nanhaiensis]
MEHRWLALGAVLLSSTAVAAPCDDLEETVERNACLHQEVAKAEDELDRYLEASRRQIADSTDAVVSMEAAHGAWLRYRDSHCLAVYDLWGDGSLRGAQLAACLLEHTQRRTHDIWSVYLAPQDKPEGILPEPARSDTR